MGNICRSPTAHGVMQSKLNQRGLEKQVYVDSAGTHAYHVGEKSDARSRQTATERGIDMDYIRARKVSAPDYNEFDYILAMDNDNLDLVLSRAPNGHQAEVTLFLSYANLAGTVDEQFVPDPYYGGESGFEQVFDLVDKGCDALIEHILRAWHEYSRWQDY